MSYSNCCFLTYVQVSQEAVKVVWYFHLLKNFPKFVVIHTVKGFDRINKAEVDVFLFFSVILLLRTLIKAEFPEFALLFSMIQWMLAI